MNRRKLFRIGAAAITGGLTVAAAASLAGTRARPSNASSPASAGGTIPGVDWETVAPAEAGLDAAVLDQIAAQAEARRSNALLVVRDGRIAAEWNFRGTRENSTQNIYSVSKSIASTLIGIAQDQGYLEIDDPASTWITEWKGTPSEAVTVRNLLSNDSGREWTRIVDVMQLLRAPDRTAFAIGLAQTSPPGTVWAYNNAAIQTLQRVLQRATGQDVVTFAGDRLFAPLGMTHTTMTTDPAGNAQLFQGVRSSARDLARFGLLMLNHGRWGNQQIVSAGWVEAATSRPSSDLVANYGYLWWLNREGVLASPAAATDLQDVESGASTATGRMAPGAPDLMYWALGAGSQIVQVDPDSRTVVVRLGIAGQSPVPVFNYADAARVVTEAVVE